MMKEKLKRQFDQFFTVRLDEDETAYLAGLMDDWAMDEYIIGQPLYADLRDDVDSEMEVNRADAHAITGCLETEENWGAIYRKFAAVYEENKVLPS